jgi:hypothetical protein
MPRMDSDLIKRLKKAVEESGRSPRAVSLEAGMSADAARGILRNKGNSPTVDTVSNLARALRVAPEWLAFGVGDGANSATKKNNFISLNIIGEVAAGLWMDCSEYSFDPERYDVPADPRFSADQQFLLRIRGNSINRRAPEGSLIRCVTMFAAPREARDGDWVVVRRQRADGTIETTVKRYCVRDGVVELWPDSDDARYQTALRLDAHECDEISIVAFVLDFITPATRL